MEDEQINSTAIAVLPVNEAVQRKTYTAPRLHVLGSVTDHTAGISGGVGESDFPTTKRNPGEDPGPF